MQVMETICYVCREEDKEKKDSKKHVIGCYSSERSIKKIDCIDCYEIKCPEPTEKMASGGLCPKHLREALQRARESK